MSRRDEGFFASKDGTQLAWRTEQPDAEPRAWVGLVHGYGDHMGRYAQPMAALVREGYAVLALDYRGHGKASGARGDCGAWSDYLDDFAALWGRLTELGRGKPVFLLAHSHGALMATHFVATHAMPELKGLVMTAPFYALAFEPPRLKVLGARLIKRLIPGLPIANELKPEQLSRDVAWQRETAADPLYGHTTTPRWFFGMQEAQARLAGLGGKVTTPVLVLAGSADPIASMPAARAFFETIVARDKTWKEYDGALHEVLMEIGKEQVWADISQWISAHL